MEIIFTVCVICLIFMLVFGINSDSPEVFIAGILYILCLYGAISSGIKIWSEKVPTSIEVYHENTTLETIYLDSVGVDSVVIGKEETR